MSLKAEDLRDLYRKQTGRPWTPVEGTEWLRANPEILRGYALAFDAPLPGIFPRVYKITLVWRLFYLLSGTPALLGGLYYAWNYYSASGLFPIGFALWLVLSAYGLYVIVRAFRFRVVLYEDYVDVRDTLRSQRLWRRDIVGETTVKTKWGVTGYVRLRSRNGLLHSLSIPNIFNHDALFERWTKSIRSDRD